MLGLIFLPNLIPYGLNGIERSKMKGWISKAKASTFFLIIMSHGNYYCWKYVLDYISQSYVSGIFAAGCFLIKRIMYACMYMKETWQSDHC